jgi:hypothetical protein
LWWRAWAWTWARFWFRTLPGGGRGPRGRAGGGRG